MEKVKTSIDEQLPDFQLSESLNTPSLPFKINIVHDYLSDKSMPVVRPSLQPPIINKPEPIARQTFSIGYKTKKEQLVTPEEPIQEKKQVQFGINISEHKDTTKTEEHVKKEVRFGGITISENKDTPTAEQILAEMSQNDNDNKAATNNSPINEKLLETGFKERTSPSKKPKTVIIAQLQQPDPAKSQNQDPPTPERIKSHTFSSPNKKPRTEPRNSKLLAFNKIVDPLEKIDQENQAALELQATKQKLVFSDLRDRVAKYPTFMVSKLEDISSKLEELDQNVGKFTAITTSNSLIVIGTQLGYVLVYCEKKAALKTMHSGNENFQSTSITAVDVAHDEEVAIVGYSNAQLELFDLLQMSSLRVFKNVHSTPILAMKFYHDNAKSLKSCKVLSSDNSGKLLRINFEKGLFSYDCEKQLVLDKTAGQITQIELLSSPHIEHEHKIVALASLFKVMIIQLEPKINKIFTLTKPESMMERNPASISWTEGIFQTEGEETSILLLISWGKHYFLVNLKTSDDKSSSYSASNYREPFNYKGQLVAHLQIYHYIRFSAFISNRIVLSYLENNQGVLVNLEDFEEVSDKIPVTENNLDDVLKSLNHSVSNECQELDLTERIVFNSLVKDRDNMARSCYSQSFASSAKRGILLLLDGELMGFQLFTWQKYVNSMINTGDRFAALASLIRIYKGEEKYVSGIVEMKSKRLDMMREYAQIMAQDYLLLSLKRLETKEKEKKDKSMQKLILTISEFLIEIEDSEFLFTEIQKILQECNLGEQFLEGLEPFILKGKIRYMPECALQNTVNFFKNRDKKEIIQRLIISLDLKQVDAFPLINLCLEMHFFKALIYICTIYCQDYMTPLIKIFNLFEQARKAEDKEARDLGLRCLWYLKNCLKQETILQTPIPDTVFELIVQQLVVWVFEAENLKCLVQSDEKTFFDVIMLFFISPALEVIARNRDNIRLRWPVTLREREIELIKNLDLPVSNTMIAVLQAALVEESRGEEESSNSKTLWFHIFVGKLVTLKRFYISPGTCLEAVLKLLEKPTFLDNIDRDRMIFNLNVNDDEKELEKSGFLLKIIKYCENELTKEQFDDLIRVADISPFCEVNHYVNYLVSDYKRCFEIFLSSKNKLFQKRVHEWLEKTLLLLQRASIEGKKQDSQVKELKDLILSRLTELMMINSEKTHRIITRFMKSSEKAVIKSLASHPRLQMEYLERIINSRESGEFIDNDLLLVHIELLCRDESETKLLNILKTRDYPLNESLKLCQSYKRNEATAFLLERTGAIEEALNLYLDIYERSLDSHIKQIAASKSNKPPSLNDTLMSQMVTSMLNLCKNHKNYDFANGEDLWFKLLDKMIEFDQNKIFENSRDNKFSHLTLSFKRTLGVIFEEISKNISLLSLLKNIRDKYFELNLGYLKNTFMAMISNFLYEKNILDLAKQLLAEANYYSVSRLLADSEKGYYNVPFCLICLENLDQKARKVLFFCGHCYHSKCLDANICPICKTDDKIAFEKVIFKYKIKIERIVSANTNAISKDNNPEDSLETGEDNVEINRTKSASEPVEQEKKEKIMIKKRRCDRLRIYDKNRQEELNSIQSFAYKYKD